MEPRHTTPEKQIQKTTAEIIHPLNLPEAAFQSYIPLRNNASEYKEAFIAGELRNPELEYPDLNLAQLQQGIAKLHNAIEQVRGVEPDNEKADIIATTLEFRIAEMEYISLIGELNLSYQRDDAEDNVVELATQIRLLGEQLYGVPDIAIKEAAQAEVWRQLDAKQYSPSAQRLYDELRHGFAWNGREVPPLPRPESAGELPDFNDPSLAWAGEIILEHTADMQAYFNEFWDQKVAEHGSNYIAHPEDIMEAYKGAFLLRDPEGESGVSVVLDPKAPALTWESSLMAITVGGKRLPVRSADALYKKWLHEGEGHGGRAINGLKTGLSVLGTGLFTNTARPDYLTFEEGLCTTIEEAVSGTEPKWGAANLGHYLNIAQTADGADFRDVYEMAWRYRVLLDAKENQDVDDEIVEREKGKAYAATVRIFKGSPLNLTEKYPGIAPLTNNRELAYLNGRILAMDYIKKLHENDDKEGLLMLFQAKYDPTIPEQAAIVDRYCNPEDIIK